MFLAPFLFAGLMGADVPLPPPSLTLLPGASDTLFGTPAPAGDVDGDGFSDLVVGAGDYTDAVYDEGGVFVYTGSAGGPTALPASIRVSGQLSAQLGSSVAGGDTDGDGFSDIIAGATFWDDPLVDEGGAFLYRGSAAGLDSTPSWSAESDVYNAQFGVSVAAADIDADGDDDVLVGARYLSPNAVSVYLGSGSGPSPVASQVLTSADGGQFGDQIAAGDVNGDGYEDVAIGAPWFTTPGLADCGAAYLYLGAAGVSTRPRPGPPQGTTGTRPSARSRRRETSTATGSAT